MRINDFLNKAIGVSVLLLGAFLFIISADWNNFTMDGLADEIATKLILFTKEILSIIFVVIVLAIYYKLLNKIGHRFNWWQKDEYGK